MSLEHLKSYIQKSLKITEILRGIERYTDGTNIAQSWEGLHVKTIVAEIQNI